MPKVDVDKVAPRQIKNKTKWLPKEYDIIASLLIYLEDIKLKSNFLLKDKLKNIIMFTLTL